MACQVLPAELDTLSIFMIRPLWCLKHFTTQQVSCTVLTCVLHCLAEILKQTAVLNQMKLMNEIKDFQFIFSRLFRNLRRYLNSLRVASENQNFSFGFDLLFGSLSASGVAENLFLEKMCSLLGSLIQHTTLSFTKVISSLLKHSCLVCLLAAQWVVLGWLLNAFECFGCHVETITHCKVASGGKTWNAVISLQMPALIIVQSEHVR